MAILDWIYPKKCLECGVYGRYFCSNCRAKIERRGESLSYSGIIRKAIKEIKYRGTYDLVTELVEIWDPVCPDKDWVITSVPMWSKKKRVRGYNQAELIAREVASRWGLEYIELLIRSRETGPMYGLGKEERKENVREAFDVCLKGELPARTVLIDDVYTSGATTHECKTVLLRAGVRRVEVMTLAR